jgi:hypothetical protein
MADVFVRGPGNTVILYEDQLDGTHARVIELVSAGSLTATDKLVKGRNNTFIRYEDQGDGTHAKVIELA